MGFKDITKKLKTMYDNYEHANHFKAMGRNAYRSKKKITDIEEALTAEEVKLFEKGFRAAEAQVLKEQREIQKMKQEIEKNKLILKNNNLKKKINPKKKEEEESFEGWGL